MKSVICAVLILFILITGGIFYTDKISAISEELGNMQSDVFKTVEENDYKNATDKLNKLEETIEDKRELLGSVLDHNELDNIESSISKIKIYIKTQNKTEALAHLETLLVQLDHLSRNFKITLENIL